MYFEIHGLVSLFQQTRFVSLDVSDDQLLWISSVLLDFITNLSVAENVKHKAKLISRNYSDST